LAGSRPPDPATRQTTSRFPLLIHWNGNRHVQSCLRLNAH
jgi:hypothetical protein